MRINRVKTNDIKPCGYYILIQLVEIEEKTESGIVLTSDTHRQEQNSVPIGKVLKIGPACYKNHESGIDNAKDWGFDVGSHVQFPSHAYKRVEGCTEKNLVMVLDHDILAEVQIDE